MDKYRGLNLSDSAITHVLHAENIEQEGLGFFLYDKGMIVFKTAQQAWSAPVDDNKFYDSIRKTSRIYKVYANLMEAMKPVSFGVYPEPGTGFIIGQIRPRNVDDKLLVVSPQYLALNLPRLMLAGKSHPSKQDKLLNEVYYAAYDVSAGK